MNPSELVADIQARAQESRAVVTPYSFGELANMYREGELVISPEYQRLFRWSDEKQSQFIESLLLELPLPPLFLIQREDETYEIADGLQRMSTYLRFTGAFAGKELEEALLERVQGELTLQECDIVPGLNGLTYKELPTALAIRLRRSRIDCAITRIGSNPNLRYYIFKRLNSGGEKLSAQESRSSFTRMLNPAAVEFIIGLSKESYFESTIASITDRQREEAFDQELVLRFMALLIAPDRFKHDIEPFLTEFLEDIATGNHNLGDLEWIFASTFKCLSAHLGDQAFTLANKSQFSVLHFEGIAIGTAKLITDGNLGEDSLKANVEALKTDQNFLQVAKGGGKNSGSQFRERVRIAMEFLKK